MTFRLVQGGDGGMNALCQRMCKLVGNCHGRRTSEYNSW